MRADYAASTVTPEAVQLHADVAGVGSRTIALLVDTFLQGMVLLPVLFVSLGDGLGGTGEAAVIGIIVFVVLWLYYPAFEWLWRGQTPGKRFQGIRVVRTDGQPVGLAPVLVRNLIRIVDVIALPFLALISMVITRRSQRLGDLAAGTMVVRERALSAPSVLTFGVPGVSGAPTIPASTLDTSAMTERDYTVLRTFLARRSTLDWKARQQLATRLAARVREQLRARPGDTGLTDEQLIEAAAQSYRARFTDRPG
jgi:uncharacterized RDD family membrane protein YckC